MGLAKAPVQLASATSVRDMVASLDHPERPAVVNVDSVRTLYVDSLESAPGTVSQEREAAQELIRLAKKPASCHAPPRHVPEAGHITGPQGLKHAVHTALTT